MPGMLEFFIMQTVYPRVWLHNAQRLRALQQQYSSYELSLMFRYEYMLKMRSHT
jgi:hypothetical protein